MTERALIFVLGDQLSHGLASLKAGDPDADIVVMGELTEEATYVRHHKKKLVFIFSAMRHFAEELRDAGWEVDYAGLNERKKYKSFTERLSAAVKKHKPARILVVEPGEYRVKAEIETWEDAFDADVEVL
ncbi:MAG: cryptochrome/photolyase family protein, partial [Pseudomonadota bacterium]